MVSFLTAACANAAAAAAASFQAFSTFVLAWRCLFGRTCYFHSNSMKMWRDVGRAPDSPDTHTEVGRPSFVQHTLTMVPSADDSLALTRPTVLDVGDWRTNLSD